MSEVQKEIRRESAKIQDVAFKLFAVVGFLSSIVTIISWLSSTQASLSATITPTTIEMPADLQLSKISSGAYDIESAITDLRDKFCNPVVVDYNGDKSKNFYYNVDKCDDGRRVFDGLQKIFSIDGKKLIAWDVILSNDGKNVAENVILRSAVPVTITAADSEGNPASVKPTSGNKVFSLPNLNPRESLKIRLTSSTPMPDDGEQKVGQPKVTYSGGVANNRELIKVSGRYSGIVDFLDGLPTVLQVIVIIIASLFITLIWLVPIAMAGEAAEKRKKAAKLLNDD